MDYANMIDHTLLKADATKEQVKKLCEEAMEYGFHSVCVNSSFVYYCAQLLKDLDVKDEIILRKLREKFELTLEQAQTYI